MSQNSDENVPSLHDSVARPRSRTCRSCRPLTHRKIPLSVTVPEPHIIDYDNQGWRSGWVTVQQSALRTFESVNDQLKNVCQIEHTRHRSPYNFLAHLLAGLVAYCHLPKKSSLQLDRDLVGLPAA